MEINNSTILFTQLISIFSFILTLFFLYRVLVKQKDATIELLKTNISFFKDRVDVLEAEKRYLESQSSDKTLEHFATRNKVLEEEIQRLMSNQSTAKDDIKNKQLEIEKLKISYKNARDFINTDPLTGLHNRLYFSEHAMQFLEENRSKKCAFLYLDIDNFKTINDTEGHEFGDKLLVSFSERLRNNLGKGSYLTSRLGGDEFVSILEYRDLIHLKDRLSELINILSAPHFISGKEIYSSASIGVSLYPEHGQDLYQLLKSSDEAMFKAKLSGKNKYEITMLIQ